MTKMASIKAGLTPASPNLTSIWRSENPQSTRTRVPPDLSSVELPLLPEPRWVISIPTTIETIRPSAPLE